MNHAEHVRCIVERVYQVVLPLPFALSSVNCYLLQDDSGWTVVDSGLNLAQGRTTWQQAFDVLHIHPSNIRRIILTHFHPDHYGMAGWLQQAGRDPASGELPIVLMSPRDSELARMVWNLPADHTEPMIDFFRAWGVPANLTHAMADGVAHLRSMTLPHPEITLLEPGTVLDLGKRRFTAIHTPGHSDGHLVFYNEDDQLLLCGDHVLLKITPHIGLWPESEPDPLGRYQASLHELQALNVRLALPGHGPLITDWAGRLAQLQQHHSARLEHMLDAVGTGATAYEVSTRVFSFPQLTPHEIRFAIAETLSHLELLTYQGRIQRDDSNGVPLYEPHR